MEWTKDYIKTFIDKKEVLNVDTTQDMFKFGEFDENLSNPWKYDGEPNAPFNQEYYLIFNVAVGGVAGYFPDG